MPVNVAPRGTLKSAARRVDYALVGGGLQNGLIVLALMKHWPSASFALVERAAKLGKNHLWSFNVEDLGPTLSDVIASLVTCRWDRYRVVFPNTNRELDEAYACISSADFHDELVRRCAAHAGATVLTEVRATRIEPHRVVLEDGSSIDAGVVIDGRGPSRFRATGALCFQKFVGLEFAVRKSLRDTPPVFMDARVSQGDGFRFFRVLPLGEHRVLVEDTYFSDSPKLDVAAVHARIISYATRHGMEPTHVLQEERGVLPLPSRMPHPESAGSPYAVGYAGGWFHPTTGYSFPIAARVAELFANHDMQGLSDAWMRLRAAHAKQARFCTFLNRLLYGWFTPEERCGVLERFYGLPAPTIRRFFAMTTSPSDRMRIVCGRRPKAISVRHATARGSTLGGATT